MRSLLKAACHRFPISGLPFFGFQACHSLASSASVVRTKVTGDDSSPAIAFFDLETTFPTRGQGSAIIEFGAIVICPRTLLEIETYQTFVKPQNPSLISSLSPRPNGITADVIRSAPTFADIAGKVYDILHGRIWAGHNISRFDCPRLNDAFSQINRTPPEPIDTVDSCLVLASEFGKERAGNLKLATLAQYFGLGKQPHRSLDDIRLNIEVFKSCAFVLFMEDTLASSRKKRMEASLGKKLKNGMLPEIEKVQKKKEKLLNKQHREALLLDDDFDRSINEAIEITKRKQISQEPVVRREGLRHNASANGKSSGTVAPVPLSNNHNTSFTPPSPDSLNYDESDDDHKSEQLDRGSRREGEEFLSASEDSEENPQRSEKSSGRTRRSENEIENENENENVEELKIDQPVTEQGPKMELEEQNGTPMKIDSPDQEEFETGAQKKRFLDLNELAPGSGFEDGPIKDDDADDF